MACASASAGASAAGVASSCRRSSHARRDTSPSAPAAPPGARHCGRSCCAVPSARRTRAGSPAAPPPGPAAASRDAAGRQRPGLVSDAPKSARVSFQNLVDRISGGLGAGFEHHRPGAIHHADRGGFDVDIQSSKVRHGCPPMPLGARLRPRWTRITMEDSRLRLRVSARRIPARYANLVCACGPCATMLQRKSAPLPLAGFRPRAISQRQPHMRNQGMLGLRSDTGPYPLAIVFASA